jgi:dTDP-4-dehydrorhamnose 3,5-epimerase
VSNPSNPFTWAPTALPGVWRRSMTVHPDDRGSFMEIWREGWTDNLPDDLGSTTMRQANLSRSKARVLRGLHVHRRQADLWIVLDGRAFIGLVDVRPLLSGAGPAAIETIDAGPGDAVYLPEGVAHGFYAREALTLCYLVTNEYDGSDELGFTYRDPDVAVPWPDDGPIVSERDATAPRLRELVEQLKGARAVTPASGEGTR